jgi:hypothetical protein
MNIQRLLSKFVRERDSAQEELAKFQEAFQKDAAHALSWGTSVFVAAGKERVYNQLIQFMNGNESADPAAVLSNMTDLVLDKVLHRAKYPPQSTSPTSNLMEQYEMAAWANVLTTLNDYKSYPSSL